MSDLEEYPSEEEYPEEQEQEEEHAPEDINKSGVNEEDTSLDDFSDQDFTQEHEHGEDDDEDSDDEEGEGEEGKIKMPIEPNPVTDDTMRNALSQLAKAGHGLSVAYIRVDLNGRDLTDITALRNFIHLRHVNLCMNFITDITSLSSMTHLLTLQADNNRITSLKMEELAYLQTASFGHNRIRSLDGVTHPNLQRFCVSHNRLKELKFPDPTRLEHLTILDVRGNKLTNLNWEFPQNIEELYAASNLITSLQGVTSLKKLRVLHLRENQLVKLEGLTEDLTDLQYLNIRGNMVEEMSELKQLQCLPQLCALVVQDNPIFEQDEYRVNVVAALLVSPTLERVDKDTVDDQERSDAQEILGNAEEEGEAMEEAVTETEPTWGSTTEASSVSLIRNNPPTTHKH